jgi:dTDP-glucose 4,6-dehydratase
MGFRRKHGLETRIVRVFNCHGPNMRLDDGRVVPNYVGRSLRGEPLTVYGDGSQTRSLCYVDDLVSGLLAVLHGPDPLPFNVGTDDEVSMLDLARLVKRLTGSSSEIEFGPLPEDDPKQRRPDLTRARQILGWAPAVAMEDGLRRTVEYFRASI